MRRASRARSASAAPPAWARSSTPSPSWRSVSAMTILLADARLPQRLFTDELIAADKQLDVMGGSAGAILALLRLYRDTQSGDALGRAMKCGEHLLAQAPRRIRRAAAPGSGKEPARQRSTACRTARRALPMRWRHWRRRRGREEFADAAAECVAFEDSSYDAERHNWPDLRSSRTAHWPCQWCHGAPGIGLARIGHRNSGAA